jgi:hypothetical protein
MKKITIVRWLLGIWAVSLGFRYALELGMAKQFIIVPNYLVNIWFDFVLLFSFGLIVLIYEVDVLRKEILRKGRSECR